MFFFFQAEDGIRDGRVTGVQTCALPISWKPFGGSPGRYDGSSGVFPPVLFEPSTTAVTHHCGVPATVLVDAKIFVILDRKSTRLNSSHPSISYAVFCLKKKKKKKTPKQP